MDTIEFQLRVLVYPVAPNNCALAYIFINGKDLLDTIYEFEKREGLKVISHVPLAVAELYKNLSEGNKAHAVSVFYYDGDATFFVNIEIYSEKVIWKDFVLSHASSKKNFGEFVFDKAQYFREVEKLKRWSEDDSLSVEYGGIEGGEIKLSSRRVRKPSTFTLMSCWTTHCPTLWNSSMRCAAAKSVLILTL